MYKGSIAILAPGKATLVNVNTIGTEYKTVCTNNFTLDGCDFFSEASFTYLVWNSLLSKVTMKDHPKGTESPIVNVVLYRLSTLFT